MGKRKRKTRSASGVKGMKLIAIKQECYALTGVETTTEIKKKYKALCKGMDFRKRKSWEYLLKRLRADGDWVGIRLSEIERLQTQEQNRQTQPPRGTFTFHPNRVTMDQAAENDD